MQVYREFLVGATCAAMAVSASSLAHCEDLIVEDPGPAAAADAPANSKPVRDATAPTVYGWSAVRPVDCAAFSFWDGQRCVDTRTETRPARN
jgi:hypothetical protein